MIGITVHTEYRTMNNNGKMLQFQIHHYSIPYKVIQKSSLIPLNYAYHICIIWTMCLFAVYVDDLCIKIDTDRNIILILLTSQSVNQTFSNLCQKMFYLILHQFAYSFSQLEKSIVYKWNISEDSNSRIIDAYQIFMP